MIVMKFGGTSVQDAAAINRTIDIVKARLDRAPVVVVSAMARVTDGLLEVAGKASARKPDEARARIAQLAGRHLTTARDLVPAGIALTELEQRIGEYFEDLQAMARSVAILGELTARSKDAIVSFGERLSSLVIAAAFRARGVAAELVDSRQFLITSSNFGNASPLMDETRPRTRQALLPLIERGIVPIAQGFVGSTVEGITSTIGRGGSDYSASIIGASLDAAAIEIWTDVDGLMTADPRMIPEARRIRVISFEEASELSYFGAKVLHPSTVLPAVERKIPVQIFNTQNPGCEGTLIVAEPRASLNLIKALAFKRNVTIVNVTSTRMLLAYGFLRTIFEVFERHQTSIDVVTTSEVSVSMSLDSAENLGAIRRDLDGIGEISVESGKAIICVVGDNLKFTPGVAGRLFQALGDINVNMISQGASEINLTFVIDEQNLEVAVGKLHRAFFSECDPAVFG